MTLCAPIRILLAIAFLSAGPLCAAVIAFDGGYRVTYGIDMSPGTSNFSDITSVFILETDGTHYVLDRGSPISGSGITTLSHVTAFAPTSAIVAGIGYGTPGVGDGVDHIYMLVDRAFADSIVGTRWSAIFPGMAPASGTASSSTSWPRPMRAMRAHWMPFAVFFRWMPGMRGSIRAALLRCPNSRSRPARLAAAFPNLRRSCC